MLNIRTLVLGVLGMRGGGPVLIVFILCTMLEIIKMMTNDLHYDFCGVKNSSKHILVNVCILSYSVADLKGWGRPLSISLSSHIG